MLTQAELLARALDMEEGNIKEHRNYLANEAEKRKRAHVVRTAVKGPLLRWISRREEKKVMVDAPPPPLIPSGQSVYPHGYAHVYGHLYPQHSRYSPAAGPPSNGEFASILDEYVFLLSVFTFPQVPIMACLRTMTPYRLRPQLNFVHPSSLIHVPLHRPPAVPILPLPATHYLTSLP